MSNWPWIHGRRLALLTVALGCTNPNPRFEPRVLPGASAGAELPADAAADQSPDAAADVVPDLAADLPVDAAPDSSPDLLPDGPATVPISVDDRIVGTGLHQFNYSAQWSFCGPCSEPSILYRDSNTFCNANGATATFTFQGTRIHVYGVREMYHGIGAVSIDGGAETNVDFYGPTRMGNQLVWSSPSLPPGRHTLTVRVTRTKNPASGEFYVVLDRVAIE